MRAILSLMLICLLTGIEMTACPLCLDADTCETSVCSEFDTGIIATAQGKVKVTCPCNHIVLITVKDINNDVKIENKEMTRGQKLSLNYLDAGEYTVEAKHKDTLKVEEIEKVTIPD